MGTDAFWELSHHVEDGLVTYPGLPAPRIEMFRDRDDQTHYDAGTSFAITAIEMVGNTGTYLDAPFHRFAEGTDLAEIPLTSLANLPGLCVATSERRIGPGTFDGLVLRGKAVLVATGWSSRFGSPEYLRDYPHLTAESARLLREAGAALVGIDAPNVDDDRDGSRPVHTELLAAEIPIVEHLTGLDALPRDGFHFFAVPPKIRGFTSFPVRAFALARDVHEREAPPCE